MSTWRAQFTLRRLGDDPDTVAHVAAEVTREELLEEKAFLKALREGLTKWVIKTQEGMDAYMESFRDFNIGDLANVFDIDGILEYTADLGIVGLHVETGSEEYCEDWVFDTLLVDDEAVRAAGKVAE